MPVIKHWVKQAQTLPSIATQYGFRDWATIWEAPENAKLRENRNPYVLYPGDLINIPERNEKEEPIATEQCHRFRALRRKTYVVVRVLNPDFEPYVNTKYKLTVGSQVVEEYTDDEGWIDVKIPANADTAWLEIGNEQLELRIGMLDPPEERSGYEARLINLGYLSSLDPDDTILAAAIENFQKDNGLKVDGIMGPKTIKELRNQNGG